MSRALDPARLTRSERIALKRQQQPMTELERKWNKVKDSRHARHYWTAEWLDLAHARAALLNISLQAWSEPPPEEPTG